MQNLDGQRRWCAQERGLRVALHPIPDGPFAGPPVEKSGDVRVGPPSHVEENHILPHE